LLLFSDSSCAVFKVRLKFSFLFRDPKLQNDTETIFEAQSNFISDFYAGSFTGLPPALLPS